MKEMLALLNRDLKLAHRQGGGVGTALGFFLAVLVLLPLGLGPELSLLQRLAPGLLWIILLLAVLLSADRIFQQDFEDGSLDGLVMTTLPLELLALTKAVGHWLSTSLPLSILAPILGFLINIDVAKLPLLTLAMVIGSLGLSLIASIGAALTLNLRRAGLLISILVLPLYIPILIFGISASSDLTELAQPALLILSACVLIALVLSPLAVAAILRNTLR